MKKIFLYTIIITVCCISLSAVSVYSSGNREYEPIIFSHSLHAGENEMECTDCHAEIMKTGLSQRSMPDHDVCSDCHEVEEDDACATCHKNPDEPEAMPPYPGAYDGFAHNMHTDLKCSNCHGLVINDKVHLEIPEMADCQTCHAKMNGPLECKVCHLGEEPKPVDHKFSSWHQDHGMEASVGTSDCSQCHDQSTCDDCHQGENIDGKPHPAGWVFNHFAEADFGGECMVCHESRETCTACHRSMNLMPHPYRDITFANENDGGSHKELAESFIETCISCHDVGGDDPTCSTCHN